jgi:hypothetical protein
VDVLGFAKALTRAAYPVAVSLFGAFRTARVSKRSTSGAFTQTRQDEMDYAIDGLLRLDAESTRLGVGEKSRARQLRR